MATKRETKTHVVLDVGDTVQVNWSNGHGHSLYRIADHDHGSHVMEIVEDIEYPNDDRTHDELKEAMERGN